jgi:hypothetical protein
MKEFRNTILSRRLTPMKQLFSIGVDRRSSATGHMSAFFSRQLG